MLDVEQLADKVKGVDGASEYDDDNGTAGIPISEALKRAQEKHRKRNDGNNKTGTKPTAAAKQKADGSSDAGGADGNGNDESDGGSSSRSSDDPSSDGSIDSGKSKNAKRRQRKAKSKAKAKASSRAKPQAAPKAVKQQQPAAVAVKVQQPASPTPPSTSATSSAVANPSAALGILQHEKTTVAPNKVSNDFANGNCDLVRGRELQKSTTTWNDHLSPLQRTLRALRPTHMAQWNMQ